MAMSALDEAAHVARWAAAHPLAPAHVDCAVAVMLKILDGKCKMAAEDKRVMTRLYDAVHGRPALRLADGLAELHATIAAARRQGAALDEPQRMAIYERRVLAETMISRTVMKAFKAMIRAEGLFDGISESRGEDDE